MICLRATVRQRTRNMASGRGFIPVCRSMAAPTWRRTMNNNNKQPGQNNNQSKGQATGQRNAQGSSENASRQGKLRRGQERS